MDITNDGEYDLLFGHKNGHLLYFTGTGSGTYHSEGKLTNSDGSEIKLGEYSSPVLTDWDNDGLIDLMLSGDREAVMFYKNVGTKEKPAFKYNSYYPETKQLRPQLQVIDIDRDGDRDFVMGTMGGNVIYYPNIGSEGNPMFPAEPTYFTLNGEKIQIPIKSGKQNLFPYVVDWNNDGHWDMILGHPGKTLYLYSGSGSDAVAEEKIYSKSSNPLTQKGDMLYFAFNKPVLLSLFDMKGRLLFDKECENSLSLSAIPKGCYVVRISLDGFTKKQRIVLQ